MTTPSERLQEILNDLNLNKSQFAKALNLTANGIGDVIREKKKKDGSAIGISRKLCERIIEKYPQYNKDWIMFGTGNKTIGTVSPTISDSINNDALLIETQRGYIALLLEKNEKLVEENIRLKEDLKKAKANQTMSLKHR